MSEPAESPPRPVLSIVVPFLNEEEVLEQTYAELKQLLDGLGETYEMVFVDDGSTDRSRAILAARAAVDPTVRVVALSRNFGHEMATSAGLHHSRGQAVIVMDADLQDPPELIKEFLARWREGYQVVYGVRSKREGETWLKKLTSYLFYRVMGQIADVPIPADTGDFRLMDRRVLDVYALLEEDPRFFRGLITWIGFKQVGVPFLRRPRAAGETKYRYGKLLRLAMDTITAFSTYPAFMITITAMLCFTLSVVGVATTAILWACDVVSVPGWAWMGMGFLALWNVQFMCIAVLGEYIVRTHKHVQRRPNYIVDVLIEGGQVKVVPGSNPRGV
jgi:dolichol-phosphate mannosyltransferase